MSTGQIFWHFPHRVQVSGFHASWRKLTRLKSEKIAPRGQEARQKGRLTRTEEVTNKSRIPILTQKREPIMARTLPLIVTHGRPALTVPIGQSLENQCTWVRAGTRRTRTASAAYRRGDAHPGSRPFQVRILCRMSWRNARGTRGRR